MNPPPIPDAASTPKIATLTKHKPEKSKKVLKGNLGSSWKHLAIEEEVKDKAAVSGPEKNE